MDKSANKQSKPKDLREILKKAFIEEVLTHEHPPTSVFAFAKKCKVSEEDFYKHFNSLPTLQKTIWLDWFNEVVAVLEKDNNFHEYALREKILSLYFTWFEKIKSNRSYALYSFERAKLELDPVFLIKMKAAFHEYVDSLITQGRENGEVAERPFSNQYGRAFWVQFLFVSKFWLNDESDNFEKTDAAIEKSVNLAFDLIGSGPIDRLVDFAKFLYQNQKPF